jgi:hypothetical protein
MARSAGGNVGCTSRAEWTLFDQAIGRRPGKLVRGTQDSKTEFGAAAS